MKDCKTSGHGSDGCFRDIAESIRRKRGDYPKKPAEYCRLDTLAMVRIWEALNEL